MTPLDIFLMILNYIRNTITCANPVILYFHRKEFFCGDFQKKFADETTKALFQNEFYFVFQTIHNLFSPRQVFIQCSLFLWGWSILAPYLSFSVVVKQSSSQFSFNGTCLTRGPKTSYFYPLSCYVVAHCSFDAGGPLKG